MNPLNAAVGVLSESNFFQPRFRHRWYKFPLCALFLMLALLASRAAYAATYTVTDLTDNASDTGSLRYAVNTAVSGDTINFSGAGALGTITLTNGTLTIGDGVTIAGPGANLLTISGNHAVSVFTINSGTVSISGLTIANGKGTDNSGTDGGAIYSHGTVTIDNCAFIGNTTSVYGGAIFSEGNLTVNNSTFSGNSSTGGAAIENYELATVNNSTFTGNSGNDDGGIMNAGTLTVNNSTFTSNSGGDIYNLPDSTVTLTNSIVADGCNGCGTQATNNMIGGTPSLGPLQYNGGTTQTMMPLPGSPAIGAGSGSTLATDQRGFARSTGLASDLGAVSTNYLTVTTTADSADTTTCTGGATCSLRDAITVATNNGSGDVVFQSGLTGIITVINPLAQITGNLTVSGTSATPISFSQNIPFPFELYEGPGANVALSGLTVTSAISGPPFPGQSIINNQSGTLAINGCTFSGINNQFVQGIILNDGGALMVMNSTFSGNTTQQGALFNSGPATVTNSTFSGNTSYEGGAIYNQGPLLLADSTISGNLALNAGYGGGIYNNSGTVLIVANSIVAGNTSGSPAVADDCANCGTQNPSNMIGGSPALGALASNGVGATVQTMLPLPGSPAIQAGDATQLPLGLATDERGFPRLTSGKLDLGAAQTNYTSVQFVQQPSNALPNAAISPAVTLEVLETNTNLAGPNNVDAVDGIPITLILNGSGTFGGTLTQTTSGGVASFGDLTVNAVGTGNTLATTLTVTPPAVTPAVTLTATSNPFDVTLQTQTITFNPLPPASVVYGSGPITLLATSSAGLPVTFQVDSGSATIIGNTLTITGAGTVLIEADAAGNATYAAATPVPVTILVSQAASNLSLTSSVTSAPTGGSVTLTATATSATSGVPTGPVTFADNGVPLGTVQLSAGVANLSLTTLPAGTNTITATYPGDTNFLGSNAQLAGTILVGTPGFTMTSNVSSFSIVPGRQEVMVLTLTPTFGYTGSVNFACSNLPKQSKCLFSPTPVTFNGSGNPVQENITILIGSYGIIPGTTTNVTELRPWKPLGGLPILPAMFFWVPGTEKTLDERYGRKQAQRKSKSKSARMLLIVALLALSAGFLGLVGCAGQTPFSGPAAGQQTITITATGTNGASQSIAVQVAIQ